MALIAELTVVYDTTNGPRREFNREIRVVGGRPRYLLFLFCFGRDGLGNSTV